MLYIRGSLNSLLLNIMTESDFHNSLLVARHFRAPGADDLWSLYMALADDAQGDDLMAKLDAYKDNASADARALYFALFNPTKA